MEIEMNIQEASKIIGYSSANRTWIKNMVSALNMCAWQNTPDQWQRLEAGEYILRNWSAYLSECQAARNRKFKEF
jgi:hypothetical protein